MNEKLLKQLRLLVNRTPAIECVLLFGSRALGDAGKYSDIDLAVKAPTISEKDWLIFSEQVENELDTLLKVDLIRWETASTKLKEEIEACHQVLFMK